MTSCLTRYNKLEFFQQFYKITGRKIFWNFHKIKEWTVIDSAGSPVVGATVGNHGGSSRDVRTTTTDADGTFRLDNVFRRHDGHQLTLEAKGFAPQQLSFKPGTHEQPGKIAITLEPGHAVSGKVVNEKGEPLSDVWIVADGPPGSELELNQHTTSDPQGRFSFDSLTDSTSLDFTREGYSPLRNKRVPLDGNDDVIVTLPDEGVSVPQISCNSVDFPAPLRPTRPSTSPFSNSKLTSRRAANSL